MNKSATLFVEGIPTKACFAYSLEDVPHFTVFCQHAGIQVRLTKHGQQLEPFKTFNNNFYFILHVDCKNIW